MAPLLNVLTERPCDYSIFYYCYYFFTDKHRISQVVVGQERLAGALGEMKRFCVTLGEGWGERG